MRLERAYIEELIYGPRGRQRFTQDSPVLPEVWIQYGLDPLAAQDLLLTPHRKSRAGILASILREALERDKTVSPPGLLRRRKGERYRIAYTQTFVSATLYFEEVVRVLLPRTVWWHRYVWRLREDTKEKGMRPPNLDRLRDPEVQAVLARGLEIFARGEALPSPEECREKNQPFLVDDLVWMVRIVGVIAWVRAKTLERGERVEVAPEEIPNAEIVAALADLLVNARPTRGASDSVLWLVNRNRDIELAVSKSRLAVKADAACQLFNIDTGHLAWAIVDSGIDARHPAFCDPGEGSPLERTRVVKTFDFTRLRTLLDPQNLTPKNRALPEQLRELLNRGDERAEKLVADLKDLKTLLLRGREIDWELLESLLEVPHEEGVYERPADDHGTHVAGILGGGWEDEKLVGITPQLKLYDLRVLGPEGGDEFSVLAALQMIQHLNGQKDFLVIHGANLSLSLRHEVANYACGRTPVCEECERLVASGVVVVAAAGNVGYLKYTVEGNKTISGYQSTSITDPGNAEGVITVGATHRYRPHTFGVSYFSSRGPTGDGRLKPDLVAPGEKVTAPTPGEDYARKDGTSMAAPHVSGAAAILMARYKELVGQPRRIKQILCDTATDLGRERYFQGCGMVDVLRALQAV